MICRLELSHVHASVPGVMSPDVATAVDVEFYPCLLLTVWIRITLSLGLLCLAAAIRLPVSSWSLCSSSLFSTHLCSFPLGSSSHQSFSYKPHPVPDTFRTDTSIPWLGAVLLAKSTLSLTHTTPFVLSITRRRSHGRLPLRRKQKCGQTSVNLDTRTESSMKKDTVKILQLEQVSFPYLLQ